jgi:hypothetical protein
MKAWKGSRLKKVGLEILPTYKRVAAWFPDPPEDTESLFQRLRRLNRGVNTGQGRLYERRKEPKGIRLVVSIDSPAIHIQVAFRKYILTKNATQNINPKEKIKFTETVRN